MSSRRRVLLTPVKALMVLLSGASVALALPQAPPASQPRVSRDFELSLLDAWMPTDLEVQPGERLVFTATGTASCSGQNAQFGPGGLPRSFTDLLRLLPLGQAGRGALIGRVGEAGVARSFLIGSSTEMVAGAGGPLALSLNHAESDPCSARFSVHVDVFSASDPLAAIVARRVDAIGGLDQAFLRALPRRVTDRQGSPGDMVNFLILGSEAGMRRVFEAAGWVQVDRDIPSAVISGVLGSLSKEAYLTMPMSQLYLFDRPQDFGWAHAEPIRVVAARHHLRIWRAPSTVAGSTLWVGAATHDIGFERDQRNNGVTHRIDPNVDAEREYVEKTLTSTGLVAEFGYVLPDDPVREARTATGGSFYSDGRVLFLRLAEPSGTEPRPTSR